MKYLIPYLKKYKKESILAPLFKMLEACFDLIVPLIVADLIDVGIAGRDTHYILTHFGLLLMMALLGLTCSFTAQYFAARAATGTSAGLRHELLDKIQSLSLTEFDQTGAATLITRMTSDVNQVQNGLNMTLRLFMRSPFIVFGAMIMAFTINAKMALLFVAAIIVLFIIVFGVMKLTAPLYRHTQQKLDKITEATREDLTGVRVIRVFGREETQIKNFAERNSKLLHAQIHVGDMSAIMNPLTYVTINAVIIAVLWFGSNMVEGGVLFSGDIIALINYINQILVELVKLANLIVIISKSLASMGRVGQVLDMESSMTFDGNAKGTETTEVVRFDHVDMRYAGAGADSLTDITFTAKKGQTIGIIGGTGSGKSSLVQLILRFYDAAKGTVYLNGEPIQNWSQEALREKIAIVPQKAQLFTGTIRSNLLMGKADATEDEMWRALEIAQAAEVVRGKAGGLDEPVEQGGANFSGGQKQRLTIARALIAQADILILDDSSSALDYATDAALRKALKTLPEETTVFIVSQRAGTIAHADQILVLDDGQMAGIGTHEELLASCQIYREIYESQFEKKTEARS